jgi:hypothetical protein
MMLEQEKTNKKVAFTVTIQEDFNSKFNEIVDYYQSKNKYGRVYKHQILQLIIDETHTRMKGNRII